MPGPNQLSVTTYQLLTVWRSADSAALRRESVGVTLQPAGRQSCRRTLNSARLLEAALNSTGKRQQSYRPANPRRVTLTFRPRDQCMSSNCRAPLIGPIPWGHSGPLCHALSLSSSLSSSWTSHAACAIAIAGVQQ